MATVLCLCQGKCLCLSVSRLSGNDSAVAGSAEVLEDSGCSVYASLSVDGLNV